MPGADLAPATTRGAGTFVAPAPRAVRPACEGARLDVDVDVDVAIIGGGCSGLATAARLAAAPERPSVLVMEGRTGPDPRSWCSWDDGGDPLPEARSASWTQWEVQTDDGASLGVDPAHPYVLVRAEDRRAAAQRRLDAAGNVRLVAGSPVSEVTGDGQALVVGTNGTSVRAATVLDARGPRCPETVPQGNVLLHQRFVGRWVTTTRPVFDPRTVTLMDFSGSDQSSAVRFVYVLPVSETSALVESTTFTPDATDLFDHRAAVDEYLRRRWGLRAHEWRVDDEETGCIPMTDVAPERLAGADDPRWHPAGAGRTAAVVGTTRPSSGYGFARSNRHSAVVARHLAEGTSVPAFVDRRRTRFLDAVFLRFLRDRPDRAAEAFRRLFALPGPLVVRFMSERSTLADDVRIVLALQKRPFLAALLRTVAEGLVRVRSARRSRA